MTLINGFEDIIAHIKDQDQKIMSLEEEHKQVKKENEELKQEKVKWESLWFNQNEWCNELTEKVDNLKEENEELKAALARAQEDREYDNLVHKRELADLFKGKFEKE